MFSDASIHSKAIWQVADTLRGIAEHPKGEQAYFFAYLMYIIKSNDLPVDSLSTIMENAAETDPLIRESLEDVLAHVDDEKMFSAAEKTTLDSLRTYLLTGPAADAPSTGESSTPDDVASLAVKILDIQAGERTVDYGSGTGNFLELAAEAGNDTKLIGVELNRGQIAAARIRAKISGSSIEYEHEDMFAYYEREIMENKVDKAFSNYPWGLKAKHLEGKSEYLEKVLADTFEYGRSISADWVFNRLLVDSIKEDGTAVSIMPNGPTFNMADARIRKHFIESGWIRAVVSLPTGLFSPWTNLPSTLVVLGHGNTEGIRLVDATDLGTRGRRGVSLSEADVQAILLRLSEDSERSTLASMAELAKREYTLSAINLLQKEIKMTNPIAMGDLILEVTRGAGLRATELDELACAEDTGIRYLNLANITDGSVDDNLPFLKRLDPEYEKCCLKTGDLLLSKNGAPYKIAVAEVPEGQIILANGNLYIIKLDTDKVDPYYLAAFLNSSDGKELLARASKGAVIPNLPLSTLRAMRVPLEKTEVQQRISAAYRAKLDEISALKLLLARARQELVDLFSKEVQL